MWQQIYKFSPELIFLRGTTEDPLRLDELDNLNGKEIVLNKAFKKHFFMKIKK